MPVLDTVVLFGAGDSNDSHHERARRYLRSVSEPATYLAAFALLEFDVVLKSRGFSFEDRMEKHASLLWDCPYLESKVANISPATFYLASKLEMEAGLEYFDSCVAAEALELDGKIVSTDRAFDGVEGLRRIW